MNEQDIRLVKPTEAITISEHVSVIKCSEEGQIIGFSESDRDNLEAAADQRDTSIHSQLTGKTPQGEGDTLIAAKILIAKLNSCGGNWGEPQLLANESADCIVKDQKEPGTILRIQVVRANTNSDVWHQLKLNGSINNDNNVEGLVDILRGTIQKKIKRYSLPDRQGLVLALDANRIPEFILDEVRNAAIEQLNSICAESSFASVWVIGPKSELTYALFESQT